MKRKLPLIVAAVFVLILVIGLTWQALTRDDRGTTGDDDVNNSFAPVAAAPYSLAA